MDLTTPSWGWLVLTILGGLCGAGVRHETGDVHSRPRSSVLISLSFSFLVGTLIVLAALLSVVWLHQTFQSWDWVLASLVGATVTGVYAVINFRAQPAYARSLASAFIWVVAGTIAGLAVFSLSQRAGVSLPSWDWTVVALLGGLVGMGELLSRYRDAPTRAVFTLPALVYILINALAALAALSIAGTFGWTANSEPADNAVHWPQVLAAGLGAMTLLRSAVFTVRTGGGQDLAVGPSALLQTLLDSADTALTRLRAQERAWAVARIMERFLVPRVAPARLMGWHSDPQNDGDKMLAIPAAKILPVLPIYCIALTRLDKEASAGFSNDVSKITNEKELSDWLKLLSAGLVAMDIVGQGVLDAAVRALADEVKSAADKTVAQTMATAEKTSEALKKSEVARDATNQLVQAIIESDTAPEVMLAAEESRNAIEQAAESAGAARDNAAVAVDAAVATAALVSDTPSTALPPFREPPAAGGSELHSP